MRRGIAALAVLCVVAVAVVLWRMRDEDKHASNAKIIEATHAPMRPGVKSRGTGNLAWLAQPGVAGRRIAGVVTTEDGAPVRGARVRIASARSRVKPGSETEVLTDEAGRFDFGVQPALAYLVGAEAPRVTGAFTSIDLRDPALRPAPDQLRLVLQPCIASIHGTIRDSAGGVVPGARLSRGEFSLSTNGGVEADASGAYELCVPPGGAFVSVGADGYATLVDYVNSFGRIRRDFELVPGATVVGRVVRDTDKAPIAGALVELSPRDRRGTMLHAVSDDDGRFEIDGVVTGRHEITATADGLATETPVYVDAEIGRPSDEVECPLVAAYSVSGTVVEGEGGKPIAGAEVRLLSMHRASERLPDAVTQADGSFVLERITPDDYHVSALDDRRNERPPQRVTVASADVAGVVIEVGRRSSIAGRITIDRKPLAGVWARVDGTPFQSQTDHEGRFEITNLTAGTHVIYAESHRHGAFTRSAPIILAAGEAKTGVDLELDLAGLIEGVVVDQNGAPVPSVFLRFSLLGGQDFGAATTADDGSFAARALAGGGEYVYDVRPRQGGVPYPPVSGKRFDPIRVADGKTHITGLRVAIRYERLPIVGRVLDTDGGPQADVTIRAVPTESGGLQGPSTMSDENGGFTLRDLPPGTYDLHARSLHGDGREAKVEAGRTGVEIRLISFSRIEGVLEGFTGQVDVFAQHEKGVRYRARVSGSTFTLRELPPGSYTLTAYSPTELGDAQAVAPPGVTTKVTLAKKPTGLIEGVVRDKKTGVPIEGAYCASSLRGGDRSARASFASATSPTKANGTFRIERVQVGTHEIRCTGGTRPASAEVTVTAEQITRVELTTDEELAPERTYGTAGVALELQLDELRVKSVVAGGPAARAGIAVGDVVVKVNGQAIAGRALYRFVHELDVGEIGTVVKLVLERGNKQLDVSLAYEAAE